ncbi:MAG: hypothetical protein M3Z16_10460 [Pseudomonadota bacterium]|nr:hypothetical protein [Pseudomonadota bacterium]
MSAVLGQPVVPSRAEAVIAPAVPAKPAVKPEASAADRLNASRAKLRSAMMDIAHPAPHKPSAAASAVHRLSEDLLGKMRRLPGAMIFIDSLQAWWAQHPLRTIGLVAEGAARGFLGPAVQRRPFPFIAAAVVAGALVVASKPWRWLLRPALFVGLVPQLLKQALRRMPIESVVGIATGVLAKRRTRPAKSKSAATKPAAQPSI